MRIPFTKMQGLGNDFVLIDNRNGRIRNFKKLSEKLCQRRFGIGADQLILLCKSRKAHFRMRIFNADGSEVEMCGNGIRCLAQYIWDKRLKRSASLLIETPAGIIRPEKSGALIKVDMGEPMFYPESIPVNLPVGTPSPIKKYPIRAQGKTYRISCVSLGNPHAVIVTRDTDTAPVMTIGPVIENHRLFPRRTNVEFIQVLNRRNIRMRVWERGSGETMACGTGASAAAVVSSILGLTERRVTVHLQGGRLLINWASKNNHVFMTGPGEKVFEGFVEV